MNRTTLNRAAKIYKNIEEEGEDEKTEEALEGIIEDFQSECEEVAEKLYIRQVDQDEYDLQDFITDYYPLVKSKKYTLEQAIEKYVVKTVTEVTHYKMSPDYLKKRLEEVNRKFNTKHFGTAEEKLKMLEKINKAVKSGNFSYSKLNDPDYYDIEALKNYGNIVNYHNSFDNRLKKYKGKL